MTPPAFDGKEQKLPTATLPGMTGPLIGNGPGYTNGEAIALPILSSFSKKMQLSAASDKKSSSTATTTSTQSTPTAANGATLAAPAHIQCDASVSPLSSVASTPSKIASFSSTTASPQSNANGSNGQLACARGGADAGIVVVSGGTACNSLVQLLQDMTPNVTYVCKLFLSLSLYRLFYSWSTIEESNVGIRFIWPLANLRETTQLALSLLGLDWTKSDLSLFFWCVKCF